MKAIIVREVWLIRRDLTGRLGISKDFVLWGKKGRPAKLRGKKKDVPDREIYKGWAQWNAGNVQHPSLGKRNQPLLVAFTNFHGINIPNMADSQLLVWHYWMQSSEEVCISSLSLSYSISTYNINNLKSTDNIKIIRKLWVLRIY